MSIVGSRTGSTIRPWELLSNFAEPFRPNYYL
jgi:hypothetical protein